MKFVSSMVALLLSSCVTVPPAAAQDASSSSTTMKKCPLRPLQETPPIEFALPRSVLSHAQKDLPIEFVGMHPLVVRKNLPYGSTPKVTVYRYSSDAPPEIGFDDVTETVTIKSPGCTGGTSGGGSGGGSTSTTGGSAASTCSPGSMNFFSTLAGATVAAAAAMNENTRPMAALLAAGAAAAPGGMLHGVHAHEEQCLPTVQVVVEAPAAYRGAIEVCLDEVKNPDVCPDPFPTFPTCDDPEPTCKIAVVGAGAGGLYTALRMVDEGMVEATDVCVFEHTERVGGRLVSLRGLGPDGDMTIDAGGYRTWPQFTPTAHALITEYLGIPMDCYDDTVPCEVYNIVDENGKKAGFATFVEEMMRRLTDQGACFYPYHELVAIHKRTATAEEEEIAVSRQYVPPLGTDGMVSDLTFANGVTATATWTTILNIPQRPLLSIIRNSNFDDNGLLDRSTLDALHSVQTVIAQKLYLYYPRGQVWWRQLGLRQGDFEWEGTARRMLLAGRYHDGPVYCDDEDDPDTCHGFLLAVYNNDLSGNKAQYFRRYQRDREEPVTFFSEEDLEGAEFLKHAHDRLVEYHTLYNTDANYTGFQASSVFSGVRPPPYAILSNWNTAIPWAGGAWHAWTDLSNVETAMQPFAEHNLFVVNEAYSLLQGWAEGSIKLADEILEEHFGIARPWDFEVVDVNQLVRQTSSEECAEGSPSSGGDSGASDGGNSGGSDGGGGVDASDAILCFAADSKVEMADGTLKAISEVKTGDFVATGTHGYGKGLGLVTRALVHPVEKEVAVAVIETDFGELVGTPDHPVYWQQTSEWIELEELQAELGVRLESRFVDQFYNLEVDGNILEADGATHSYVVNGVTASGLGDHAELNRRYPRQKYFQQQQQQRRRAERASAGMEASLFKARHG